jgi:hypothetical protein
MVHSYWTPKVDGSGLRLRIKRSNVGQPFETERITITPEELEADITFFKTTQNELGDFLFEIVAPSFRTESGADSILSLPTQPVELR